MGSLNPCGVLITKIGKYYIILINVRVVTDTYYHARPQGGGGQEYPVGPVCKKRENKTFKNFFYNSKILA